MTNLFWGTSIHYPRHLPLFNQAPETSCEVKLSNVRQVEIVTGLARIQQDKKSRATSAIHNPDRFRSLSHLLSLFSVTLLLYDALLFKLN